MRTTGIAIFLGLFFTISLTAAEAPPAKDTKAEETAKEEAPPPPKELVRYLDAVDGAWQLHGAPVFSEDLYGRVILVYYYNFEEGRTPSGLSRVNSLHRQYFSSRKFAALASIQAGPVNHAARFAVEKKLSLPIFSNLPLMTPVPTEETPEEKEAKAKKKEEEEPFALPEKLPAAFLYNADGTLAAKGTVTEVLAKASQIIGKTEVPPHPYLRNVPLHYCKQQARSLTGSGSASYAMRQLAVMVRTQNKVGIEAAALLKSVNESTEHTLQAATAMASKYPLKAVPVLENLAKRFAGLKIGKKANEVAQMYLSDITYKEFIIKAGKLEAARLAALRRGKPKDPLLKRALLRLLRKTRDDFLAKSTPVRAAVIHESKKLAKRADFVEAMKAYETLKDGYKKKW